MPGKTGFAVPRGVSESEINHTNKAQIPASRFLSLVLQACRYYFLVSKHKQFPLLLLVILLCGGPASFSQAGNAGASVAAAVVAIPFIGCKSDGQVGPLDAPTGQAPAIKLSAAAARRLAYYKAENGIGVLAPRGWRCFSTYGSNGSSLFVSPEAFDATRMFSTDWKSFAGPAIQISIADGGTSGAVSGGQGDRACFSRSQAICSKRHRRRHRTCQFLSSRTISAGQSDVPEQEHCGICNAGKHGGTGDGFTASG